MKWYVFILFLLLASCASKPFNPYTPPELKFEKTSNYNIQSDLEKIPKPEKIEPIYVQFDGNNLSIVENSDNASHILLAPSEYAKVGAVVKLAKTYKTIIIEQEELVNSYVAQINSLKELLEMERQKVIFYRELWVNSENLYRLEKKEHENTIFMNKMERYISIGGIIFLLIAL